MNTKWTAGLGIFILGLTQSAIAYDDGYGADNYPPAPEYSYSYTNNYSDDSVNYESGSSYDYQEPTKYSGGQSDNDFQEVPRSSRHKRMAQKYQTDPDSDDGMGSKYEVSGSPNSTSSSPLPQTIAANLEKVIIVDPRRHAWGAYDASGKLLRWGLATAGASWCRDTNRPCRTKIGTFRMYSLGDESCYSKRYPVGEGGAPMPYCMYFHGNMAIHGSNEVVYGNVSHGCVRVHVADAEWLRNQFVESPNAGNSYRGTKVIIKPY